MEIGHIVVHYKLITVNLKTTNHTNNILATIMAQYILRSNSRVLVMHYSVCAFTHGDEEISCVCLSTRYWKIRWFNKYYMTL